MSKMRWETVINIENNHGTINVYTGIGKVQIYGNGVGRIAEDGDTDNVHYFTLPDKAEELELVEENPPGPGPGDDAH